MASQSIISQTKECFYCGTTENLHRHHCVHGTAGRAKAEEDGLWIWICASHHEFIHGRYGHAHDVVLHQIAEKAWLKENKKTIPDWIERYGKNWL